MVRNNVCLPDVDRSFKCIEEPQRERKYSFECEGWHIAESLGAQGLGTELPRAIS